MKDRLKLFSVYHPEKGAKLADDVSWPNLKKDGWKKGDEEVAVSSGLSGEMQLDSIGGAGPGAVKSLQVNQQVQGSGASVACVQFSNDPDGPWETCQPDAGDVQAAAQDWDPRSPLFSIDAKFFSQAYVRVGVWPDQSLAGPPVLASNVERPNPWTTSVPE